MRFIGFIFGLLVLFPVITIANVIENISYKKYFVKQNTGESLLLSFNRSSPIRENGKTFHGYTSTWITWWPETEYNGQCFIKHSTVKLTVIITLPELVSDAGKIKGVFFKYVADLHQHELGHLKIAQDVANKIDKKIMSLPPMSRCSSLERASNLIGYELLEESKKDSKKYDESTLHGRTQGVVFPNQ